MRTAVAAPAPPPSADEMLAAIDRMTPTELESLKLRLLERITVKPKITTTLTLRGDLVARWVDGVPDLR